MSSKKSDHIVTATGTNRPAVSNATTRKVVPPDTKFAKASPEVEEELEEERTTAEEQTVEEKRAAIAKRRKTPRKEDVQAHVNPPSEE